MKKKPHSEFTYVNVQQTPKPRNKVKIFIVTHCQSYDVFACCCINQN
jgi:hypothetical protein